MPLPEASCPTPIWPAALRKLEPLVSISWADVLDIGVIGFLIYQGLLLVRGTRAASMLIGVGVILAVYLLARRFELHTTSWLFDQFITYILIFAVVIFQHDIRRFLVTVGRGTVFRNRRHVERSQTIEEIVKGVVALANKKLGSIIVIQRKVGLNEYVEAGTELDARVSREIFPAIFAGDSPIHDGAAIVTGNRVDAAGCLLPLTTNPNVARTLGTRHRAAIGLTEETDAIALVVSEEDQNISLVVEGHITRGMDTGTLRQSLTEMLGS